MANYTPLPLTGRKISIDAYVAMAFAALRKRPLCRFTLESDLTKLTLALHQAAAANGYDVDQAFDIVHKSNYTKFWTAEEVKSMGISPDLTSYKPALNKYVVFNQSGKVTKPPSFLHPTFNPLLSRPSDSLSAVLRPHHFLPLQQRQTIQLLIPLQRSLPSLLAL